MTSWLKEKLSSGRLHVVPFPGNDPVILAVDGVEGSLLETPQLEGETRPELFEPALLGRLEVVPVVPEKDKVSLVVKGHRPLAFELGVVVEQAGQHPGHRVPQPRGEIVEDHFGPVLGDGAKVAADLAGDLDVGQLEVGSGSVGQMTERNYHLCVQVGCL